MEIQQRVYEDLGDESEEVLDEEESPAEALAGMFSAQTDSTVGRATPDLSKDDRPDLYSTSVEMLNVPLEAIEIGDRFRKSYQDLPALAEDMKKKGVIQPIAVKKQPGDKSYLLLAGGRRYSAALWAKFPSIPCRVYPYNLTDLDIREIELMENVSRKNLDWKEEARLTEEIHRLQVERFGEAHGSSPGHSAADTAKILNTSAMSVSRDRALAAGLDKHGDDLNKAKNKSEALRTLKRLDRQAQDKVLATKFDHKTAVEGVEKVRKDLVDSYFVGDFFKGIEAVPERTFNIVEIDPPYAIDLAHVKSGAARVKDRYEEISTKEYPAFLSKLFSACSRVMLPNSWLICWCAFDHIEIVKQLLEACGLEVCPIPGLWIKHGTPGQTHHPEKRLASLAEPFFYARKGEALIRKQGRSNIYSYKVIFSEEKDHATERPIELIQEILSTFSSPGGRLLVPFLGSGNTLLAGVNCRLQGLGWELHGEHYKPSFTRKVLEAKAMAGQLSFLSYKYDNK